LRKSVLRSLCAATAITTLVWAQRGGNDWMTAGFDAQRSSWVRADPKIAVEAMGSGFILEWKRKLPVAARPGNAVTAPALLDFYIGYRGFRTLGFVGDAGNNVTAIDTDINRIEWEKKYGAVAGAGTAACPGGMTSTVTRPTNASYPPTVFGRGFGRSAPAKSGVGEPGAGAVTLKDMANRRPPGPPPVPPQTPGAKPRTAPAASPFGRGIQWLNAITADGKFHSLYVSNGEEPNPAVEFLPANAHARGLLVFGGTAYAATVNGCGGAPNGVWALDIESKKVSSWKAPGNVSGSHGFAALPDGTLIVSAGSEMVALGAKTLEQKATFKVGKTLTSSPVLMDVKNHDLAAVTTDDGQLNVFDAEKLAAGPVASIATGAGNYAVGALASWLDPNGGRWIAVPHAKGVSVFGLTEQGGSFALKKAWDSRPMAGALTPITVNGVMFAVSSGRPGTGGKAVLYALEGASGKELWNSGAAITSYVSSGGLAAGGSRVYVSGHDGVQYAFAFHLETLEDK